jgi:hypothetical protein
MLMNLTPTKRATENAFRMQSLFSCKLIVLLALSALTLLLSPTVSEQDQNRWGSNISCRLGLEITSVNIVNDSRGDAVVLGKIMNNNQTTTFYDPNIIAEFYDTQNNLMGVESADAEMSSLTPNSSAPFKLVTRVMKDSIDKINLICDWSKYELTDSADAKSQEDISTQDTVNSSFYNQCIEIAGGYVCNSVFKK